MRWIWISPCIMTAQRAVGLWISGGGTGARAEGSPTVLGALENGIVMTTMFGLSAEMEKQTTVALSSLVKDGGVDVGQHVEPEPFKWMCIRCNCRCHCP